MHGRSDAYWRKNLQVLAILLTIWFAVSYLCGIVFVKDLNEFGTVEVQGADGPRREHLLGGFPLGFWFAQQGSIYVFILLTLVYAIWMDRIDAQASAAGSGYGGFDEGTEAGS